MVEIYITKSADKDIRKLPKKTRERIKKVLKLFRQLDIFELLTRYLRKLKGYANVFRARVGVVRLIFLLKDSVMHLVAVDHRKNIYKRL